MVIQIREKKEDLESEDKEAGADAATAMVPPSARASTTLQGPPTSIAVTPSTTRQVERDIADLVANKRDCNDPITLSDGEDDNAGHGEIEEFLKEHGEDFAEFGAAELVIDSEGLDALL